MGNSWHFKMKSWKTVDLKPDIWHFACWLQVCPKVADPTSSLPLLWQVARAMSHFGPNQIQGNMGHLENCGSTPSRCPFIHDHKLMEHLQEIGYTTVTFVAFFWWRCVWKKGIRRSYCHYSREIFSGIKPKACWSVSQSSPLHNGSSLVYCYGKWSICGWFTYIYLPEHGDVIISAMLNSHRDP